jgi:hypothetical protein
VAARSSTPDDLDRARTDRLARKIAEELRTQAYSQAAVSDVDVEEWRRAARLAGRRLGLRVRTEVVYGFVHVSAIDVPLPEWVRERAQRSLEAHSRALLTSSDDLASVRSDGFANLGVGRKR